MGVGPGDPELLTKKAERILLESDMIAFPCNKEGGDHSTAFAIAKTAVPAIAEKPLLPLFSPMTRDDAVRQAHHEKAAKLLLAHLNAGRNIAYLTLGDPMIYCTYTALGLLLQKAGLLKLKDGVKETATVQDIAENTKNLNIQEVEAAQLPRTLDDVDISIINTNFAMNAELNPTKDALFMEDSTSPYVNIIAVREGDENRAEIQTLLKTIKSDKVKKFIEDKYKGAIVPAF